MKFIPSKGNLLIKEILQDGLFGDTAKYTVVDSTVDNCYKPGDVVVMLDGFSTKTVWLYGGEHLVANEQSVLGKIIDAE